MISDTFGSELPPTKMPHPAIEFRNLSVTTPQGKPLLRDISLALEAGTTTVILGRSGSGKTTLLRTINRLVEPTEGEVLVRGTNIKNENIIGLRRGIGYVIQETGLFPHFTIERNVSAVLEAMDHPKSERSERSAALLASVGLDPASFAKRYPHQLSGGQRQRVGLARALAADPAILLMDEPFGALDPITRTEMQEMLRNLLTRLRKTVVLVTHDVDEALTLADRIVLLDEGKLAAALTPADFLNSQRPEIQVYLRTYRLRTARLSSGDAHV